MSSEAITQRLRLASELRDLALALRRAKLDHGKKAIDSKKPEATQGNPNKLLCNSDHHSP